MNMFSTTIIQLGILYSYEQGLNIKILDLTDALYVANDCRRKAYALYLIFDNINPEIKTYLEEKFAKNFNNNKIRNKNSSYDIISFVIKDLADYYRFLYKSILEENKSLKIDYLKMYGFMMIFRNFYVGLPKDIKKEILKEYNKLPEDIKKDIDEEYNTFK
ncbi:hypothetical protein YN1_7980 [Nanoarchaeota archaeon]